MVILIYYLMTANDYLYFITAIVLFFLLERLYFRLADRFSIIDKPNHRSSHSAITIRGGGIIFPIAILAFYCRDGFHANYFWLVLGLIPIALVSFWDDIKPVANRFRLAVQLLSVSAIFYGLGLLNSPLTWTILGYILVIGTINAYNFMDGINGITGLYSLAFLVCIIWLNQSLHFVSNNLIIALLASLLVFLYFNFRQKAQCFAGDVGSVSMAFIVCFLLISLILRTHQLAYLGFLMIYGLDAVSTIIFRLIRRENIFEAHRSHFYQFLANEKKVSPLIISAGYAFMQFLINTCIIQNYTHNKDNNLILSLSICILTLAAFISLRWLIEGKRRILGSATN